MNIEIKSRWEEKIEKLISFLLSDEQESLEKIAFQYVTYCQKEIIGHCGFNEENRNNTIGGQNFFLLYELKSFFQVDIIYLLFILSN